MTQYPEQDRGQQLAQTSMILGILSLFVPLVGIALGIIAINKAKEAEQLNTDATVGKVTGWVGTILWILSVIPLLLLIPFLLLSPFFFSTGH
ncbi:DUF4190 domain-containing protein [Paeniglutamicibacter sp. NPDC012692]|uniref:DUF4190 domain-containing protein n=1 Tax=Paeniglutamicibacter sp. NPDC012692 TaxID=3364388 RepID=UPI00367CDFD7